VTRLALVLGFALIVVGCEGMGPLLPNPGLPSRDICPLLTTGEIEQYWGYPNTEAQMEQGQSGPTCGYKYKDGTTVIRLKLSPVAAIPCDQLKDSANSDLVPGVGDWAYYSNDRQKLYAKKGGDCLEVIPGTGVGSSDLDFMNSLTELSRLAVGRL
jgi:hypothetical protein